MAVVMLAIYVASGWSEAPLPRGMSDISGHALAYGGLAALLVRALSGRLPARVTAGAAAGAWLIAVAYGASDEAHQMFVPGRTAEMKDLVSDATGALIGITACWAWGILWVRSDV